MLFHDIELDFDIFDADTAEAYEEAVRETQAMAVKKEGETLGASIRRQCGAVFTFFDALFGDGFHKELFGERTNLLECIGIFREFIQAVDEQKKTLDTLVAEVKAGHGATPNRAARRAAARVKDKS